MWFGHLLLFIIARSNIWNFLSNNTLCFASSSKKRLTIGFSRTIGVENYWTWQWCWKISCEFIKTCLQVCFLVLTNPGFKSLLKVCKKGQILRNYDIYIMLKSFQTIKIRSFKEDKYMKKLKIYKNNEQKYFFLNGFDLHLQTDSSHWNG